MAILAEGAMLENSGIWGVHERQGTAAPEIIYKTVPEYQPSSASITIGEDPFYKASQQGQQITVKKMGLDTNTILIVAGVAVVGLGLVYLLTKRKKKRSKKH